MLFAKKLQDIDEHSGILDFVYPDHEPEDSKEKNDFLNKENIIQQSLEFINQRSTTASERDVINDITTGQYSTQCRHEFRHLLVTGKK